ncbi:MAG TPA: hypothetical protein VGQ12_12275 [Candidatus Angelobacter sp.]|jgi:hypothetical protein|nr:hypothetical protein [Candidatus Angelobacter sp.]
MEKSRHEIWGEPYVPAWGPKDGFGIREGEDVLGLDEAERALWEIAGTDPQRAVIAEQRDERRFKEHQEREKERERQAWPASTAGQLLKKLGECFAEYRECLEKDPRLMEKALEFDEMNQKIFNRMRTSMDRAHNAPRCRHEKAGGGTCRAPRVRGKKYCHMHEMLEEARPEKLNLPSLGDAHAIHAAIAKGAQAVVDGKLEYKQASILGYYLQLALSNVGRVDFENPEKVQV